MLPFFNVYSISEHDVHMLHGLVTLGVDCVWWTNDALC
jgi:hypothetical protein